MGISWGYLGDIMGISWEYLEDIFGISLGYLGDILGDILEKSWGYLGDNLGISWGYLGDIFKAIKVINWAIVPFDCWFIGPSVQWSIGPLVPWFIGPLVECQMLNVNKVNLLSERTSGVPPVIFYTNHKSSTISGELSVQLHGQSKTYSAQVCPKPVLQLLHPLPLNY